MLFRSNYAAWLSLSERAEAAARMAEAALKVSQKERQAAEIMQRAAKETAERFAEKDSKHARLQLDGTSS